MKSYLVPLCVRKKSETRLKQFGRISNFIISAFTLFLANQSFSQNLPPASSCTSKDLELVSAALPVNPGENLCSCSGTRTLQLSINNKTGSTRTSFAFWGTLERYDQTGALISTESISGCNGPIPKNAITTVPFNQITIQCNQSLKLKNMFLAWTSASPGEICPLNPATINPKCGTLPEITVLSGVDASFTLVNATCSGGTGSITTSPFGGAGPYSFSWSASNGGVIPSGQATNQNLTNLVAGTYTVVITDANNCTKQLSRTITSPAALSLGSCSKTDVTCFGGSNGSVAAGTVTNNVGTVHYSWKNGSNTVVGTTANVSSLSAGTYTLTVTDDCTSKTCSATVSQPSAALSLGTCSKTDVSCFGGSNGSVTAGTVSNNIGTVNYSWKNSAQVVVGITSTVNSLPAGSYTLTVSDNCPATPQCTVTIGGPSAALALGSCSKTDVTCTAAGAVAAGAVSNNIGTVNYSWKNGSNTVVGTTANVGNLSAGTYTLTVTDDCSSRTCSVTVASAPSISAPTVCIVQPSLCGSSGSVTITSPAPGTGIQFSIDNGNTWQSSNVFSNLQAGSVSGIKVKNGDCISPAADCSVSNCQQQNTVRTTVTENNESNVISQNKIVEQSISKLGVKAYPNPYNDHVTFVVLSPKSGYGSLEVVNMLGQKVRTVYQGRISSGSQIFEMSVPVAQRTTMFYIFKMGDTQISGKLLQLSQ